eukprot:2036954-Rhodomonas_salina.2
MDSDGLRCPGLSAHVCFWLVFRVLCVYLKLYFELNHIFSALEAGCAGRAWTDNELNDAIFTLLVLEHALHEVFVTMLVVDSALNDVFVTFLARSPSHSPSRCISGTIHASLSSSFEPTQTGTVPTALTLRARYAAPGTEVAYAERSLRAWGAPVDSNPEITFKKVGHAVTWSRGRGREDRVGPSGGSERGEEVKGSSWVSSDVHRG